MPQTSHKTSPYKEKVNRFNHLFGGVPKGIWNGKDCHGHLRNNLSQTYLFNSFVSLPQSLNTLGMYLSLTIQIPLISVHQILLPTPKTPAFLIENFKYGHLALAFKCKVSEWCSIISTELDSVWSGNKYDERQVLFLPSHAFYNGEVGIVICFSNSKILENTKLSLYCWK